MTGTALNCRESSLLHPDERLICESRTQAATSLGEQPENRVRGALGIPGRLLYLVLLLVCWMVHESLYFPGPFPRLEAGDDADCYLKLGDLPMESFLLERLLLMMWVWLIRCCSESGSKENVNDLFKLSTNSDNGGVCVGERWEDGK